MDRARTWFVISIPGTYTVTFELPGFTKLEVPNVAVQAGRVLKVDAPLTVGTAEQSVQVTESAPLIDTTTTAVATNVSSAEFDRLPKTRTFQSLAVLAPTVNEGTVEGGFQVNGASGAENNFIVDGISTTSLIQGNSRQNTAFEFLEQVQVKTSGIEAQYGGATGGVISAITKSGGNNFHGDVHYYYFGNALNAGAPKRLVMDPTDLLTVTYQQDYKFPLSNHEAGYSLGGPFIKNKLYFFSSASPRFQQANATSSLLTSKPSTSIRISSSGRRTTKFRMIRSRNCASTRRSLDPDSAAGHFPGVQRIREQLDLECFERSGKPESREPFLLNRITMLTLTGP